jgi:hypothetical protein
MGACCGKMGTLLSDSAEEAAVVAKVQIILDPRKQGGRHSEIAADAIEKTYSNCVTTHGNEHPVTNLACWALTRVLRVQALEAPSDSPSKRIILKKQEQLLDTVDKNFQNGVGFPPIEGEPYYAADETKWPGYRASRIASELSLCIKHFLANAPKISDSVITDARVKLCDLLERIYLTTRDAEEATPQEKLSAKLDYAGVIHLVPAKADTAIAVLGEVVNELAESDPAEIEDPGLFEKVTSKLAAMLAERDRWPEVEVVKRKHVAFLEKFLGEEDDTLPPVMHVLCEALARQNKWADIEPIIRRARKITYRPAMESMLASSLMEQGGAKKLEEAETLLRASLAKVYEDVGADHPATFQLRHNLVQCLNRADKDTEAEELLRVMLHSCDKIFGPDHPLASDTVAQLCGILGTKLGRIDEAVALQQEWLARWEKGGPRGNIQVFGKCLASASIVFEKFGKYELAEPIHRKFLDFCKQGAQGYNSTIKRLVENLEKQGKQAEADELRKENLVSTLKRATSSKAAVEEAGKQQEEKI